MLTEYIRAAMTHATVEWLGDANEFYGEIPECNGVYATADSKEACHNELLEVLEERILFRVHRHLDLPIIDGVQLSIKEESV